MAKDFITYNKVFVHPVLNNVIDILLHNQFVSKINTISPKGLANEDLKKAIWLTSILASSTIEEHQIKAQLFTSLLFLEQGEKEDIERVCYILMSRLENLTATKHFNRLRLKEEEVDERMYSYDALLSYELALQKEDKRIELPDQNLTVTGFQKHLWNSLLVEKRLSISAPTSAGKSFITKKHIKQLFGTSTKPSHCLYIVPSRALISQVSEEFRIELKDLAKVYTSFTEPELDSNAIYVLTPERCLRLLKYVDSTTFTVDLIFVDEIQNVEEEGGRGTLLEYIVGLLGKTFYESQIIIAGPHLNNPKELFRELFNEHCQVAKTTVSPVIQIRSVIRSHENNKISVKLLSNIEDQNDLIIDLGYDLESALKRNIGSGLYGIINLFGKDEQSIIYSPKTNLAESWAKQYASNGEKEIQLDRRVAELIDYLSEEIHPKYYLIKCLKNAVAFHHGRLSEMVRKEVEDCFTDGKIKKLFCTSTLIEGVNLPARNLFVIKPEKRDTSLTSFEFGNLIGRAGRIGESLYGNVYCIEREEHHDWAKSYFDSSFEKEVKPATQKAINNYDSLMKNVTLNSTQFDRNDELGKNVIILLRHKFYTDKSSFDFYLSSKGLDTKQVEKLVAEIETTLKPITIPQTACKHNPTIDLLLQDKLYNRIIEDGVEYWVVHENANLRGYMSRLDLDLYPLKERSLYWQLRSIMEKLDEIFSIRTEAANKHQVYKTIPQMCLYGVKWLAGDPFSKIVKDDVAWRTKVATAEDPCDPNGEHEINKIINEISKVNNTIVSHVLVKYLKLLADVLENILSPEECEKYKFSLALSGMLELGTTNGTVIQLISAGVSRSVAIKVNSIFSTVKGHEEMNVFEWLKGFQSLNMKPIYNRYLSKLGLLKKMNQEQAK